MTAPRVANIGERGARRRRRSGYLFALLAVAAFVALVLLDAPRWTRLLIGIPAGLAALEILEAREKT